MYKKTINYVHKFYTLIDKYKFIKKNKKKIKIFSLVMNKNEFILWKR